MSRREMNMLGDGGTRRSFPGGKGLSKPLWLANPSRTRRAIQPLASVSTPTNLPFPGCRCPKNVSAVMASGSWGFGGNGVPDDLAFDHIDYKLGDIGGMVCNALEVLADERQADGA